jgi:hypothetical protein
MEDILREELDKPVTEETLLEGLVNAADGKDEMVVETPEGTITIPTDELDPLTNHILDLCPSLTQGEYSAVQTMFNEQLSTSNGQSKMQFYIAYLANSSEIIDEVSNRTAQELYEQVGYYKRTVEAFDGIINTYGHLNSDEKIEFLLTQTPGLETTMKILDKADNHKKHYIFEQTSPQVDKVQTLADELGSLSTDYIVSHAKAVKKDAEELEKAQEDYYHAVSIADKKYDVYEEKPEKKETPKNADYDADAYQNILTVNEKLNYKGKISNMDHANLPPSSIERGDLLQLRVTNSNVSKAFPMFKYMVVREDRPSHYRCEDVSLKAVDIEGNEIPIDKGKEGEGDPYKIKIEQGKTNRVVSKDFIGQTHNQYALLMNYSNTEYRPAYVGDLFRAAPIGIAELDDRINSLTSKTDQTLINSFTAQRDAGSGILGAAGALTLVGGVLIVVGIYQTATVVGAVVGPILIGIGAALEGAAIGLYVTGAVMHDTNKKALKNAETNDNKRKGELKDLFGDIDEYNKFTDPY